MSNQDDSKGMNTHNETFGYKSKLAKKTYTFQTNLKHYSVTFRTPWKEGENPQEEEVAKYERMITEEIEKPSAHAGKDWDLQVTGINGRWGFVRVTPRRVEDAKYAITLLNSAPSITRYTPAITDRTKGNNSYLRQFLPDRFIVKTNEPKGFFDQTGLKPLYTFKEQPNVYVVELKSDKKSVEGKTICDVVQKYSYYPGVEYAEPNEIGFNIELAQPQDRYYATDHYQWGLKNRQELSGSTAYSDMQVYEAWNTNNVGIVDESLPSTGTPSVEGYGNYGDPNVIVAVIDYGVRTGHGDFNAIGNAVATCLTGTNFTGVGASNDVTDSSATGHGTRLTGIIAARRVDGYNLYKKVVGVVPMCCVLPLKINTEAFDVNQAVNAINHVRTEKANPNNANKRYIICIGWETGDNPTLRDAITNAWNDGIVVVCAAGNSGLNAPVFPAKHPNAIAAGAFTNADAKWVDSNYGANEAGEPVIFAPGKYIWSTTKVSNTSWGYLDGTSFAAAHLAGAAALMWSRQIKNPGAAPLTAADIKSKILNHTDPLAGSPGLYRHDLGEAVATITW